MKKLSFKERVFYSVICNENRVYKYWYTRFLLAGADLDRIRRVVKRIRGWRDWCGEWYREGCALEGMAEQALAKGNKESAKGWFHEAVACFHIGQHFYFLDDEIKARSLEKIWDLYPKAISLYEENRPLRVEVPFRGAFIPGYLRLQPAAGRPLVVQINGLDNLKETEQHAIGRMLFDAGFNAIAFDGPGQGEMLKSMAMIPDYQESVSCLIDWIESHYGGYIDMERIGAVGFSMGGYFAPLAAAYDERIKCVVANGGPADLSFLRRAGKANPILLRGLPHVAGTETLKESVEKLRYDIGEAPAVKVPLLVQHSGRDRIIPEGRKHAEKFMNWAAGEKEMRFFPDGEHVCANYLDEVLPGAVDWFKRHLGGEVMPPLNAA